MRNRLAILCLALFLLLTACEVTGVTLADQAVQELARQSVAYTDGEHVLAPADSN